MLGVGIMLPKSNSVLIGENQFQEQSKTCKNRVV